MKTKILIIISMLLSSFYTFSQNNKLQNNFEVGVDILSVFDKNNILKYNVLLRKNFDNKTNKPRAYRLRVGLESSTYNVVLNRLKLNYLFRAGYEFKKVFVNKVSINYGVDLHHSLHDVESQYILGLAQNPLPYPEKERLSGLLGFMGVKYHINENISVSLEGNFSVLHKVFYEVVYSGGGLIYINNKPIGNGTVLVDRTPYKSFDIKLQPIELINLSYHF